MEKTKGIGTLDLFEVVPLCDELVPYLEEVGQWMVLRHPLVVCVPYFETRNKEANITLEYKKEKLAEAKAKKNWLGYTFLHERPFRLQAFIGLVADDCLTIEDFNSILGEVWTDTENPSVNEECWRMLFNDSDRVDPQFLMTLEERAFLENAPDILNVYRGVKHKEDAEELEDDGISWTLDLNQAIFFAKRLARDDDKSYVYHARIPKEQVTAYFASRKEEEIIISHADINKGFAIVRVEEIKE